MIEYTATELLSTLSFIGLFDLMVVAALLYYYRRLDYSHLKFAAYAIGFELVSQIAATVGQIFTDYTTPWVIAWMSKQFFAVFILAAIAHLTKRAVPIGLVTASFLVFILNSLWSTGSVIAGQDSNFTLHWAGYELSSAMLLMTGIYYLVRTDRSQLSPGIIILAGLLSVHLLLRLLLPLISLSPSTFALTYFFDSIAILLAGVAFILICAEWMMASLQDQKEQLVRAAQERHRLELQFTQAQKLESLGALAAGIAHDFNNMLTSILGYAGLAMRKLPNDSEVRKDLYMVMSGARQANDLTSQMLVYAGKGAIEFETLDLSRVVDNMTALVNSIVPRKIQLSHRISRGLPMMRGDGIQLGQIVMNLVANSVDAIEDRAGVIEIATGITELSAQSMQASLFAENHEPGVYLYLSVSDDGVGMTADQIDHIFDPFYSQKSQSKGLGLSSISGIVRQHKGFIAVESRPGAGALFTVYFPVLTYTDSVEIAGKGAAPPRQSRGHILVADDDVRIRGLISALLESDHYSVIAAADGREAMELIQSSGGSMQLAVLDCTMPKMSGPEIYRELRKSGLTIPVVLISGYQQDQVVVDLSRDEHAYFIGKPFSVDELLEVVNSATTHYASKVNQAIRG